jgi:hypothetical protein
MAAVSFGFKGACSIWSEIEQTKYIRRSACLKEDVWEKVEGFGLTGKGKFGRTSSQMPWSPTSDCVGLAASRAEGEKGDGGGQRGGLIVAARRRLMQAMKELKRSNGRRRFPVEEVNAGKKMVLAGGSHLSAGEGKRKWVPVREGKWAAGCWAGSCLVGLVRPGSAR